MEGLAGRGEVGRGPCPPPPPAPRAGRARAYVALMKFAKVRAPGVGRQVLEMLFSSSVPCNSP